MQAACSSFKSTFLPITLSSLPRCPSLQRSIIRISMRMARFVSIFSVINGHPLSPSRRVSTFHLRPMLDRLCPYLGIPWWLYALTNVSSHSAPVNLLDADRPEPRRPTCARYRPSVQDGSGSVRGDSEGMDPEVSCHIYDVFPNLMRSPRYAM